ncbi:unnamed protein product [Sphagnum troendelagicum]|uniref:Uncharacterized protein n=1 Tax=Sphagnum troendelagicum TaxID=128251 RepID=A0ABP0UX29_9BRYO
MDSVIILQPWCKGKKKGQNLGSLRPSLWASAGLHRKCTRFALRQVSLVGRDGGAWQKNPRIHDQEPTSSLMFKCEGTPRTSVRVPTAQCDGRYLSIRIGGSDLGSRVLVCRGLTLNVFDVWSNKVPHEFEDGEVSERDDKYFARIGNNVISVYETR